MLNKLEPIIYKTPVSGGGQPDGVTVPRDRVSQTPFRPDRSEECRVDHPPYDLHDQLPVPWAVVRIDEEDLLPRPELHPATRRIVAAIPHAPWHGIVSIRKC